MKLCKNDKISYNDCIYVVVAVIWNTIYIQKTNDGGKFDYTMKELQKYYRDIEILKEK